MLSDSFADVNASIISLFVDDRLVCMGWDHIPESYADICAAFSSVCGPATDSDPEHFRVLLDTLMNGSYISLYDEPGFSGWQICDGTYLAVFHYSETDSGIMYINEALMTLLVSEDAAAEISVDSFIPYAGAIPWGESAGSVISELALEDYSEHSPRDGVTMISTDDSGENVVYVFIYDQLACVTIDYYESKKLRTYDELLTEMTQFGAPTSDCGERILNIMNVLAPGAYGSADEFSNAIGCELSDGSFMSLCRYNDGEDFALMITNEAMLSSLAAE